MGCDIHVFREVQRNNNQWACLEEMQDEDYIPGIYIPRNYMLFGLLAEVREEVPLAFPYRGIPDDVSPEVKQESDYMGCDCHTPSWLELEEMKRKQTELLLSSEPHAQECLEYLQEFMASLTWPDNAKNCRVVFWFDN